MSISMLRSIASTRRDSSVSSPNTSQYHAATAPRSATANPTWSSRAVISAMDVQPRRVAGQVGHEAAVRVAFGADRGQAAVRVVGHEPVLPPGEVGVAQVDADSAGGGEFGRPAVHPAGVPRVIGRVG